MLYPADIPWWMLVNRASVIRAAAEIGPDGGLLVLSGPQTFGHMEALSFVAKQLERFGWRCHDLSTTGPISAASVALDGMDAVFPAEPGSIPQRAQLAGLGLATLRRRVTDLLVQRRDRNAWFVPYVDHSGPLSPADLDFLAGLVSRELTIVVTSVASSDWDQVDCDIVELTPFSELHVELCLRRQGLTALVEDWADYATSITLPDGGVHPTAAYVWLQTVAPGEERMA